MILRSFYKNSTYVYLEQTKALASDQNRAIKPYLDYFGENRIVAGVYDGDTPLERKEIESKMISRELNGLVFINALELRIDIGSDTTFRSW